MTDKGATDADNPHLLGLPGQDHTGLPVHRGDERRHKDDAAVAAEAAALSREKSAASREDAVQLRENTALQREGAASSREQEIFEARTTQAASNAHMTVLQQANAHLVMATIEANELAEQLGMTKIQLENAKAAAEKANLAKSDFLSSMSHELRTPLHAILGFAQLLESGSPPPTDSQKTRVNQIIKAGWHLLELINEILDLAVIESGRLNLLLEPVPLLDVMHECQAMIEPQAQKRGISIHFPPFDNTWFIRADRIRIKQVLINLLSNAIKYNRDQGSVEIKCTAVTPDRIRISIKDSGSGLPQEKLDQLFQPFNRLGQEAGAVEGTGIGLVVTQRLVEQMGGTIGVASNVGVGSEFWIELLRATAPQTAEENLTPVDIVPQVNEHLAQRTLLYVEDNPANLMLVQQIIEEQPSLRMLSAPDGNLGIEIARAHLPDVILMDINLPGINGIQALKILHEDPVTAHIPVIALSASAMLRDIEHGLEVGFFRYITKPIKINELMGALNDALKFSGASD